MTYGQPPAWLILLVAFGLALPSSAIVGLAAVWLFRRFFEPPAPTD
jgi:membrane protein implicated in regulation of membrane protease activity